MLHSKRITIPANTTELASVFARFRVNRGVIYRVWVTFPAGCVGLAKVRIYHEGHPFLPVENDAYIRGENHVFEYPVMYEIRTSPEQIIIQGWNDDEVYEHTIDVQFLIIPKAWILPAGATEGVLAGLKSLVMFHAKPEEKLQTGGG